MPGLLLPPSPPTAAPDPLRPLPVSHYRRNRPMHNTAEYSDNEENYTRSSLSKSDDSQISNLSLLSDKNPADELDRRMLDHARLKQTRWTKRATLGGAPPIMPTLKKARPALDLMPVMRRAENVNAIPSTADCNLNINLERPPSPNIPRQWGRKGRQRNDFLQRFNTKDENSDHAPASPEKPPTKPLTIRDEPFRLSEPTPVDIRQPPLRHNQEPHKDALKGQGRGLERLNAVSDSRPVELGSKAQRKGNRFAEYSARARFVPTLQSGESQQADADAELKRARDSPRSPGSRELLRRLARAASATPSPARGNEAKYQHEISQASPDQAPLTSSDPPISLEDEDLGKPAHESLEDFVSTAKKDSISNALDLEENTLDLVRNVLIPVDQSRRLRKEKKDPTKKIAEAFRAIGTGIWGPRNGKGLIGDRAHEPNLEGTAPSNSSKNDLFCLHCGDANLLTAGDVLKGTWFALRDHVYSCPKGGRITFTWLGLFLLCFLIWSVTEITLCEYYCQPLYAKFMSGYGVDIRRPQMPYVTTTIMIRRPLEGFWRTILSLANDFGTFLAANALSFFTDTPARREGNVQQKTYGGLDNHFPARWPP